jgi:DNA-binding NtrC family response regulator
VDDDAERRDALEAVMIADRHTCTRTQRASTALDLLAREAFDVVFSAIPQTLVQKTGISGLTPATTYYLPCETQTVKGGEGSWVRVVSFLVQ